MAVEPDRACASPHGTARPSSSPGGGPTVAAVAALLAVAGAAALHGARIMQSPAGDGASPVTGFTLVYAAGGAPDPDVGAIAGGATLDLSAFPVNSFTFRADADASAVIGSVRLVLEGPMVGYKTIDGAPYTLHEGYPPGNYRGKVLADGDYRITATPYTGPDRTGDPLAPHSVRFSVTGAPAVLPAQLTRLDILEFLRDSGIASVEDSSRRCRRSTEGISSWSSNPAASPATSSRANAHGSFPGGSTRDSCCRGAPIRSRRSASPSSS